MALVRRFAGRGGGRRRESATCASIVKLEELAVVVLGHQSVVRGEVDVDTIGADSHEPSAFTCAVPRPFICGPGAGADQLRPTVNVLVYVDQAIRVLWDKRVRGREEGSAVI